MDRLRLLLQNPLSLLGIGILLIVLVIVSLVSVITKPVQESTPPLTTEEGRMPEAPRQPFPTAENQHYGALIVTSNVSETRVLIDVSEDEVAEVPSQEQNIIPATSITPFKISRIPVGKHTLTAAKPGYYLTTIPFEITANQVTRVTISLDSLTTPPSDTTEEEFHYGEWIKKLPITDPYYYIEYNKDNDTIRANLYPPPSFSQTTQEQVEQLKTEVQQKLQTIGVDLTKETIEWVVKQ